MYQERENNFIQFECVYKCGPSQDDDCYCHETQGGRADDQWPVSVHMTELLWPVIM